MYNQSSHQSHVLKSPFSKNLDTPIRDIVGEKLAVNDTYRRSQMTSRDVLSHRHGVPTIDETWSMIEFTETDDILE